jgi:hypothetical protein
VGLRSFEPKQMFISYVYLEYVVMLIGIKIDLIMLFNCS